MSPRACWRHWLGRSNSTTPSAATSSTSPAPHSRPQCGRVGARPSSASGPRSSGPSTRLPAPPRSCGNERLDVLAANQLGRALYSELYATAARPLNTARFVFLDPRAEASYGDWDRVATETVAILRSAAGRDPYNRDLSDLVGELATQSEAFRTRWAAHNVRFHNTGVKLFNHPVVGELHLSYNRLDLAADPGLTIFTYTAEPGSRSEEALKLLGSWAATVDPAESARATDPS